MAESPTIPACPAMSAPRTGTRERVVPIAAALLTVAVLVFPQAKVEPPLLLAERFVPGAGWLEIALLAVYAGFVARRLLDPERSARTRRFVWGMFSVVFFAQLALGLLGVDRMLMSGELHLPVPAVIAAGPLYRMHDFFMPILFTVTVILVGPAWCSHLCYIGAWDNAMAGRRKRPAKLPAWRNTVRGGLLVATIAVGLLMRALGVPGILAAALGLAFGLGGVAVMLLVSRKKGAMAHCTIYCPIGAAAAWMGKLSPFRLRIGEGCDGCRKCSMKCRYGALDKEHIEMRKVGIGCTLCGDCLSACEEGWIGYRLLGVNLSQRTVRGIFVTMIVALHAATLGVARL